MSQCRQGRFEGKVAVITGSAQGIGEAIARRFVEEGGKAVLADIDTEKLDAVGKALGDNVITVETDVRKKASVEAMVQKAVERFGRIDILFSNAGVIAYNPFLEETEDHFDLVFNTNVRGCFLVGQAVARVMVEKGIKGAIVNTASVTSEIVSPTTAVYASSKGAVKQLTKVMALDLGPYGIRVNCFGPGSTITRMTEKSRANPERIQHFMDQWIIKRLAEPEEQAAVALFLASEDASYMTGEIVYVDGGWKVE